MEIINRKAKPMSNTANSVYYVQNPLNILEIDELIGYAPYP